MNNSKEVKAKLTEEYGKTPNDTGSPAVQVAILTYRIQDLTEHLKDNKKEDSVWHSANR